MNTRSSNSAKGKQPSGNNPQPTSPLYPPLPLPSPDEELESNREDEVLDLRAQIQALQQAQVHQNIETKNSIDSIKELFQQLITRDEPRQQLPTHHGSDSPLPTTERAHSTPESDSFSNKLSKKRPDPKELSDGTDPTFESWRILVRGKLRANADHFPTDEDKMDYVFGRTTGKAQKHLLPRFDEDSPARFTTADEMIQYLAARYINPNKVRDARYDYGKLLMKSSETFADFQTTFLHLAGEGQIHSDNLRLDLYDKLTTQLQERLAATLEDLDTYQKLANRCLSLDTELKRIATRVDRQKRFKEERISAPARRAILPPSEALPTPTQNEVPHVVTTPFRPSATLQRSVTPTRVTTQSGSLTPTAVKCYNCGKPDHKAKECTEPRRATDLKEIEEEIGEEEWEEDSVEAGKDYA